MNSTLKLTSRTLLIVGAVSVSLPAAAQVQGEPRVTPAMYYFASGGVSQQLAYFAPQPQASAVPSGTPATSKPFQYIQRDSPITPYANLNQLESSTGIPNYYTFVQPRLQQRDRIEAQGREQQRLHRQVRAPSHVAPGIAANGTPYRDLNSYFPALNR